RPWLRPAWSALSSDSCRAPLRDVEGNTMPALAVCRYDAGCPVRTDAMPRDGWSGGFSADVDASDRCDAALGVVGGRIRVPGALRAPSRSWGSATATRSRMWSVLAGRTAGTSM